MAAVETEITTYVEYLHPGSFLPERTAHPVAVRDAAQAATEAPRSAFAFRFFDMVCAVAEVDGEQVRLGGNEIRRSGTYYIDAEKLTADDVAALTGDHSILLSNMRSNEWPAVVRCRTGNFQPLLAGDEVIAGQGTRD